MFCPSLPFEKALYELLQQQVLQFSPANFRALYQHWSDHFSGQQVASVLAQKCVVDKALVASDQQLPAGAYLSGIDLPTWFGTPGEGKTSIMVIGIDPLRNDKTFEQHGAAKDRDVVLGTPYALHDERMRTGRTKHYWGLVEALAREHFVYLTDIYKTFFYTNASKAQRSYRYFTQTDHARHLALLKKEIALLEPHFLILLGAESYKMVMGTPAPKLSGPLSCYRYTDSCQAIPMVHLSSATYKTTKINFLTANGLTYNPAIDYGQQYYQILQPHLNS